jgi:hypothetical protein
MPGKDALLSPQPRLRAWWKTGHLEFGAAASGGKAADRGPGFPVELVGLGELHAAFLTESRTRELLWSLVQEIRGVDPDAHMLTKVVLGHDTF